ncbi:carbohydrate ABC transporter substrate-binding protein (CUT1 family) [Rhodoglobus vestalii]|uniref:Carbohydrate ABC transporter substrate-binding protein (CUT1 family) n=1 Tax=Rhodoglobus vestalii TaxID=193384 RepID=A0A8H2K500_9MICO|nr:extracellular solute-binding protein [Rhodoglobus vestalii]TQO20265.1 carbohydrate ABC transporter substrate-binding protein (CUT1 family) [Rhodoglobus vestalii]
MATHRALVSLAAVAATTMLLTSCAAGSEAPADPGEAEGSITFLTNRTDLETDGTWDAYITEFQKTYPDVDVTVEALTSYADDVVTRLSTPNGYGDVLLIPASVPANQYSDFFEPLGSTDELSETYRFQDSASFDGTSYGIALGGNANGVLYNTEVFAEAGVAELPKSPDDFLAALSAIDENTDAIPYYTNYKDGWPLGGQWTENIGAVSGDPDARVEMASVSEPWTQGNDVYAIDSLIYDVVEEGLSEPDPLTTNWEQSKNDFATGKIGSMVLGSWAISQFRAAAADAGASEDVVGFMAFPTNVDGQQYASTGADYNLAINANSSNKAAARAWIDWLVQESGFTQTQGMISAVEAEPLPDNLSSLTDENVELLEVTPAPELNEVADESQVDLSGNIYRQKLIDIARGQADGDKKSYFTTLNERWGAAVDELAG